MLDNRTFMVAGLAATLVMFLAMLVISLATRRYHGLQWWTLGNGCFMTSFLLFATQQYSPPWHWSLVIANTASLAGVICWALGVRRFLGLALPAGSALASLALIAGLMHYYLVWSYDTTLRIVFISLSYVPWCLDIARVLWRERETANHASRRALFLTALALAGFCVFRALATGLNPPVDSIFQPNWLVGLAMAVFMMGVLLFNISFLSLVAVRHELDLQTKIQELNQEILLRQTLEKRLAREATLDPLTGAANRRRLEELATKSLAVARRHQRPFALAILDIDHFKAINDRLGHQAGDLALVDLAELCQSRLREEDTLARYGGDEFVALLPYADLDQALETAERLRQEVERLGGGELTPHPGLTISLGVAQFVADDPGVEAILARADAALYQAKTSGRNRVCYALSEADGGLRVGCHSPPAPLAA